MPYTQFRNSTQKRKIHQENSLTYKHLITLKNISTSQPNYNPAVIEKIEEYMSGKLNTEDVEELWAFFIQHPDWYSFFETYLTMKSLSDQF